MAERDFYNVNDFTSYPLVHSDDFSIGVSAELPRRGLVDAGFTLGLDSEFDAQQHNVKLYAVFVSPYKLLFDFRSDAPGLIGYRWLFNVPVGTAFGVSFFVEITDVLTGDPAPDRGVGFLAVGDLEELLALSAGWHNLVDPPRVEPALLHSMVNTYARSVNLANDRRKCAAECESSSSSSSSESASADDAFVAALGMVGDIQFREGFNASVTMFPDVNTIEIGAAPGIGDGEPCYNLLVDEKGLRQDIDECVKCGDLIRSINGISSPTGRLTLSGGAGATVLPDPANHKIVVKFKAGTVC